MSRQFLLMIVTSVGLALKSSHAHAQAPSLQQIDVKKQTVSSPISVTDPKMPLADAEWTTTLVPDVVFRIQRNEQRPESMQAAGGMFLNQDGLVLGILPELKPNEFLRIDSAVSQYWPRTPETTVLARDPNTGLTLIKTPFRCLRPIQIADTAGPPAGTVLNSIRPLPLNRELSLLFRFQVDSHKAPELPVGTGADLTLSFFRNSDYQRFLESYYSQFSTLTGFQEFNVSPTRTLPLPGTALVQNSAVMAMLVAREDQVGAPPEEVVTSNDRYESKSNDRYEGKYTAISAPQILPVLNRLLSQAKIAPLPKYKPAPQLNVFPPTPEMPPEAIRVSVQYDNGEQSEIMGTMLSTQGLMVTPIEPLIRAKTIKCSWLNLNRQLELTKVTLNQDLAVFTMTPLLDMPHLEFDLAPSTVRKGDRLVLRHNAPDQTTSPVSVVESIEVIDVDQTARMTGAPYAVRTGLFKINRSLQSGTPLFQEAGHFAGLAVPIPESNESHVIPADLVWVACGALEGDEEHPEDQAELLAGKQVVRTFDLRSLAREDVPRIVQRLKSLFPKLQFSTDPKLRTLIALIEPNVEFEQLRSVDWLIKALVAKYRQTARPGSPSSQSQKSSLPMAVAIPGSLPQNQTPVTPVPTSTIQAPSTQAAAARTPPVQTERTRPDAIDTVQSNRSQPVESPTAPLLVSMFSKGVTAAPYVLHQTVRNPIVTLELVYENKESREITTGVFVRPESYLLAVIPLDEKGNPVSQVFVKGLKVTKPEGQLPLTAIPLTRDAKTNITLLKTDLRCHYSYMWSTETIVAFETRANLLYLPGNSNLYPMQQQQMRLSNASISDQVNGQDLTDLQLWNNTVGSNEAASSGPLVGQKSQLEALILAQRPDGSLIGISGNRVQEILEQLWFQAKLESKALGRRTEEELTKIRTLKLPAGLGVLDGTVIDGNHYFMIVPFIDAEGHFLVPMGLTLDHLPELESVVVYRDGQPYECAAVSRDEQTDLAVWGVTSNFPADTPFIRFPTAVNAAEINASFHFPGLSNSLGLSEVRLISKEVEPRRKNLKTNPIYRLNADIWPGLVLYRDNQVNGLILGRDNGAAGGSVALPAHIVAQAIARMMPNNSTDVGPIPKQPPSDPPVDASVTELVRRYQSATEQNRPVIQKELEELTATQFDERQRQRLDELKALETRLETLRTAITQREQHKAEIVRKRVLDLLNTPEDLEWDPVPSDRPRVSPIRSQASKTPPVRQRSNTAAKQRDDGIPDPNKSTTDFAAGKTRPSTIPVDPGSPNVVTLNVVDPAEPLPKRVAAISGTVLSVDQNGYAEISLGLDDGLKLGQFVEVYRTQLGDPYESEATTQLPSYIGRLEVTAIQSDQAGCHAVMGSRHDFMHQGDMVTTNPSVAPKSATNDPRMAALQGIWRVQHDQKSNGKDKSVPTPPDEDWIIDGRLFMTRSNGRLQSSGIIVFGETKTTQFIQLRNFRDSSSKLEPTTPEPVSSEIAKKLSICFLYRLRGNQLEISGFSTSGTPADLPKEFGEAVGGMKPEIITLNKQEPAWDAPLFSNPTGASSETSNSPNETPRSNSGTAPAPKSPPEIQSPALKPAKSAPASPPPASPATLPPM